MLAHMRVSAAGACVLAAIARASWSQGVSDARAQCRHACRVTHVTRPACRSAPRCALRRCATSSGTLGASCLHCSGCRTQVRGPSGVGGGSGLRRSQGLPVGRPSTIAAGSPVASLATVSTHRVRPLLRDRAGQHRGDTPVVLQAAQRCSDCGVIPDPLLCLWLLCDAVCPAGKHLDDAQRTLEHYGVSYWHSKFPHWPLKIRKH